MYRKFATESPNNSTKMASQPEPIFKNLSGEENDVYETDSLCMNCYEKGITRMLLTRIPFFRDVLITSFTCDKCNFENRSIDPAGKIEETGIRIRLKMCSEQDLNRRIVRSKYCTLVVPSLDSSFPNSEGSLTTIEGALTEIISNLERVVSEQATEDEETVRKVKTFLGSMRQLLEPSSMPYELVIDDPSGTSQVENFKAPAADPQLQYEFYQRALEENHKLGLYEENAELQATENTTENPVRSVFDVKGEVVTFGVNCPKCNAPCESNMKMLDIPHFKEVIIMATVCESCGLRENEVKGGGGISPKGRRVKLRLTEPQVDMSRDLLKSDTASIHIPELQLDTVSGTLGGKFTTVEGLLVNIRDQLANCNPFVLGDSGTSDKAEDEFKEILQKLDDVVAGRLRNVHLILDDPAGNVYIQNPFIPEEDPNLTVEDYERGYEENEILGLNDMKTEDYN